jgi:hypothetical protein
MADSKPAVLQAVGSVLAAEVASRARPNVKLIGLLALGHLVIDANQGSLSGVLPFLKSERGLSVSVVLAQAYLPRNAGMASGLIVGFAIGTGGIAVTLLGVMADHYGLSVALWISALMPIAGFVAARCLPAPRSLAAQ